MEKAEKSKKVLVATSIMLVVWLALSSWFYFGNVIGLHTTTFLCISIAIAIGITCAIIYNAYSYKKALQQDSKTCAEQESTNYEESKTILPNQAVSLVSGVGKAPVQKTITQSKQKINPNAYNLTNTESWEKFIRYMTICAGGLPEPAICVRNKIQRKLEANLGLLPFEYKKMGLNYENPPNNLQKLKKEQKILMLQPKNFLALKKKCNVKDTELCKIEGKILCGPWIANQDYLKLDGDRRTLVDFAYIMLEYIKVLIQAKHNKLKALLYSEEHNDSTIAEINALTEELDYELNEEELRQLTLTKSVGEYEIPSTASSYIYWWEKAAVRLELHNTKLLRQIKTRLRQEQEANKEICVGNNKKFTQ